MGEIPDGAAPRTILVVDDDPINRRVLCKYLQGMGHHVLSAESAVV